MGKKKEKAPKGCGQKHLYSRISFLHQAANYLATINGATGGDINPPLSEHYQDPGSQCSSSGKVDRSGSMLESTGDLGEGARKAASPGHELPPLSRLMVNQFRSVALKGQIRLTPDLKNSFCKRCDTLLVPGYSCSNHLENKSKAGRKPWADVLVMTCNACETQKRFPVGAKRRSRKALRTTPKTKS